MNICQNNCTPNEYVCKGCGRTEEEITHWAALPQPVQESIRKRIDAETHLADAASQLTEEIQRLNSIIRELTHGNRNNL